MKRALTLALTLVACGPPSSDPGSAWNPLRREVPEFGEGIAAYKDSRWVDAEKKFETANDKTPSSAGHFDVGAAQYKQKKTAEAGENFNKVLSSQDEDQRERAYFNLGNTEAAGGNLERAKENYRRALELRPNDMDARYNLEWAQRMLDKPKDKNDKGNKDDEKKDEDKKQDDKKDESEAKNDKKEGDKKEDDAQKKKDEEKKDGEKQAGKDEKKDGQENKGNDKKGEEEKKAGNEKGEPQPQPGGEEKKDGAGNTEEKTASGEPQPAAGSEKPLGKRESAAILDSLLAGEKNLQMWKFQQNGKPTPSRSESDKPW